MKSAKRTDTARASTRSQRDFRAQGDWQASFLHAMTQRARPCQRLSAQAKKITPAKARVIEEPYQVETNYSASAAAA
jgi:hypothetical protein